MIVGRPAAAEPADVTGQAEPLSFEIAAQPLPSALDAYGAATGLQILYDSRLAVGRRSGGVKGRLAPAAALKILLDGTGLTALYAGADAFAVVPVSPGAPTDAGRGAVGYGHYFGILQAGIADAFCRHPATIPGRYRIALKFWIGPAGEILRPELLGSTNDPGRDSAIAETLRHITIDQPPPVGMPQPVTMIIAPRPPEKTGDCTAE